MSTLHDLNIAAGWTGLTTPGRCCGMTRGELLIVPADALPSHGEDALVRCVGKTLNDAHGISLICGDHLVLLFAQGGFHELGPAPFPGHFSFTEGTWPEPLGMRVTLSSDPLETGWSVESDRYGLRPIFFGLDEQRRPIVSTRPDVVSALVDGRLSAQAVAESLVMGFTFQSHSLFEGVRRLRPQERLIHSQKGGFNVGVTPRDTEAPDAGDKHTAEVWINRLTPMIVDAFERGAALELSGAVDSRLVVAAGLKAGARPKLAVTLGHDEDDDVAIARTICDHLGIEHRTLPVEIDDRRISTDGLRYVQRAGFSVNASTHAWLPSAYDRLATTRTIQIGGGGGECASGFYYSPLDPLCRTRSLQSMWVHRRLFRNGVALGATFGPDRGERFAAEITDEALRLLRWTDGSWRHRTDELYLTQQVPNAGGAELSAAACWYEPVQPLLHEPYIEWGRRLDTGLRSNRRLQMRIVRDLAPGLASIPYTRNRLFRKDRPGSEPASVAQALVRDEWVRHALLCLARRDEMAIDPGHVQRLIDEPQRHEHELGALVSAAWAAQSVETIREELSEPAGTHRARLKLQAA